MQIQTAENEVETKNNLALGVIFVAAGSASYGMLSTFVKLSYKEGFSTAEVTVAQFLLGLLCLIVLNLFSTSKGKKATSADVKNLMLAGISLGSTSFLYYLAVKYINASIAVVLLMQSVWIGVVIESFQTKSFPSIVKILSVIMVLIGTFFATDLINASNVALDIRGILFGFLAAISFSITLFSTNSVAPHLPPLKRSLHMLVGGSIFVFIVAFLTQIAPYYFGFSLLGDELTTSQPFNFRILYTYGIIISIFGTVLPPIMLNKGFPLTGVGLGSIVSSLELPFAVIISHLILGEVVNGTQWFGVFVILAAIALMNYRLLLNKIKAGQ